MISSSLCILMPLEAWIVINQNWQFEIPYIDLTYKPWRLFLIVCSLPELVAVIIFMFLPESPKFVLGLGNKKETYQILHKIHRWNNGKKSHFEEFEINEEAESIESRQRTLVNQKCRCAILKTIWNQTSPLLKPPYLKSTFLICTIQFGIFITSTGLFIFFAEIINKMSANLDSFVDERVLMCDIINMKAIDTGVVDYHEIKDRVSSTIYTWFSKIIIVLNVCLGVHKQTWTVDDDKQYFNGNCNRPWNCFGGLAY